MRVVDVRHRTIPISRYADPSIPSGGLTTSLVAVVTDVVRDGRPVVGLGFSSIGRYGQAGLIDERFAPRLLAASTTELCDGDGTNLDPVAAWDVMMRGEKPGGHGERCVAVGTLDMALWDAAAKIAGQPLHRFLADRVGRDVSSSPVAVYASGGYRYPHEERRRLSEEIRRFVDLGFTQVKMKIGEDSMDDDLRRIDVAVGQLPDPDRLAVDAMNRYDAESAPRMATALSRSGLLWFEDVCDPLDFVTQARVAECYPAPIAAGEALFSAAEAALLDRYAGLRKDRDILLFDPVHCYGLPGYLRIIDDLTATGWPRAAFWPHGGHLFALHLTVALGLGGVETNPTAFHPFHTPRSMLPRGDGKLRAPDGPGIGFELDGDTRRAFAPLVDH